MWTTKKTLAAIAVLLIVIVALGVAISYNIQEMLNRPLSATQTARQAVEAHDLDAFNKVVDTDAIINQAATEILAAQINSTLAPTAYSMDELKRRFNQMKPDFVNAARAALDEYITTGKITFPDKMNDAQKFFKQTGLANCEITSVTKPHLEGNEQTSTVIFFNPTLKFSFELELDIEQDADGNWRIVDARGFDDYYNGYRRSLRRKLDSLNAPIVRQMDEIFSVQSFKARIAGGDEYGFSETLEIAIKADVKSDKRLNKIVGNIILGKGDHESFSPFEIDMVQHPQGLQTFTVTKTLNPFVRSDAEAMKRGLKKNELQIEVTEIVFADGTNLKQLDQLPDD
ncbi:MAG: hypothetical protein IJS69_06930 [Selenomonadaceae bacterium]|nr:hypothetical protein [Selenomonadaceae bacterium]